MSYFVILTEKGVQKFANAVSESISITHLAVGDGIGAEYEPTGSETALKNEKARVAISSALRGTSDLSQIIIEAVIPSAIGDFYIREIGIYDSEGDMIAIANCPTHYKALAASGSAEELIIRPVMKVSNASAVSLTATTPSNFATHTYADNVATTQATAKTAAHAALKTTHGVAGEIVGTTDSQTLSNKTFSTDTAFTKSITVGENVTITGNETVGGSQTVNGSQEVKGSSTIDGDFTVKGKTYLKGDVDFVDSQNVNIKDANIVVNKDGTQATADLYEAGLTVNIADGTDAVVGYDSTLASKFKAGSKGSESEVLTAGHTQAMANKTLNSPVINTPTSNNGTFNTPALNAPVTTNGSSTGETITSAAIKSPSVLESKRDTRANLDTYAALGTTVNGQFVFATDEKKMYQIVDNALAVVGGGGNGDASIYAYLNSEDDSGTWTSGNSTSGFTGTIAGTFTKKDTTNILNGKSSYSYTMASGSAGDWMLSPAQTIPLRARSSSTQTTNIARAVIKYNGTDGDIQAIAYDTVNSTVLTSTSQVVKYDTTGSKIYEFLFDVPYTCTSLKFGFKVITANSGKVLVFDDIQLGQWTPQAVNLVIQESAVYYGNSADTITASTTDIPFSTKASSTLDKLGTWSGSVYTAKVNQIISVSADSIFSTAASRTLGIYKNSSNAYLYSLFSIVDVRADISKPFYLSAGENFSIRVMDNAGTLTNTNAHRITITSQAISENIVQSWSDGMTEEKVYTLSQPIVASTTNPTFGTIATNYGTYLRDGERLKGRYTFQQTSVGTSGTGFYKIPMPNGFKINTNKLTKASNFGTGYVGYGATIVGKGRVGNTSTADASYSGYGNIFVYDENYLVMELTSSVSQATYPWQANTAVGFVNTSLCFTIDYEVPIVGWSSTPALIALPQGVETDYFISAAGNASQSITSGTTSVPFIAVTQKNLTWDGTSFTAPMDGFYSVEGMLYFASSIANIGMWSYINGTQDKLIGYSVSSTTLLPYAKTIYLTAGQVLTFRLNQTVTLSNTAANHHLSISKINGRTDRVFVGNVAPSKCFVRAYASTGQTFTSTGSTILFGNTAYTTHQSAFNGSVFTAPMDGILKINGVFPLIATASTMYAITLFKNGVALFDITGDYVVSGQQYRNSFSECIEASKGDTFYLTMWISTSYTTTILFPRISFLIENGLS